MQRSRMALGVVGIAVSGVILAGCSGEPSGDEPSTSSDGPVTLEYWAWNESQEKIVAAWNESHPDIQVRHSDVGGGGDTSAKLVTSTRAGNAPDVALVEYNTLPAMIVAGVAADITEYTGGLADQFAPGVWSQTTFDGATYGVPQDTGPQALNYNKARFDELGVEVPTTWEEFAEAAEKIHEADPDAYITTFAPAEFGGFAAFAQQAGAEWWSVDGDTWTVDIDGEASRAVADYWQDLIDRDLVLAEPLLTPEWNASLNEGNILSWPAGIWAAGVLYGVGEQMEGDWALAPLPQWTPGDASAAFQGGSGAIVTTSSEHPKEAAEVILWLNASDEGAEGLAEISKFPAALHGQDSLSTPPALMPEDEDYWPLATEIAQDTFPIQWGPNPNVAFAAFTDEVGKALTNGTSVVDALPLVQKAVVDDLKASGFTVAE